MDRERVGERERQRQRERPRLPTKFLEPTNEGEPKYGRGPRQYPLTWSERGELATKRVS